MCILTGILTGIVFAVDTPRVRQSLQTKIQEEIQSATGYPISINDLHISLLNPGVEVHDVTAFRPNERGPWVTIHRARISLHPQWKPGAGFINIRLEVDGLKGNIKEEDVKVFQNAQNTNQVQEPSEDSSSDPIEIDEIWIVNTTLVYEAEAFRIAATNLEFKASPRSWKGHDTSIHVPSFHYKDSQQDIRIEARGNATILGSLFAPEEVNVDDLKVFLPGLNMEPRGNIVLGKDPTIEMKVNGAAILDRLRQKIPTLPELKGLVRIDGTVRGPLNNLQFSLSADGENVQVDEYYLGNLMAQASFDEHTLQLEELKIHRPDLGVIKTSGQITFGATLPLDLKLKLENVGMGNLIDALGEPDAWVDGNINGELDVKGTGIPFDVEIISDLSVQRFRSLLDSYRNPRAEESLVLPNGKIKGKAHSTADKITLKNLVLSQGSSALTTNGVLSYDSSQGMELRAVSQTFNLAEISPIAGLAYRGRGPLTATVEGSYDELVISGTTEFAGFGIDQFQLGKTQATVIFADNALQLPRIFIQKNPGTLEGTARLEFGDTPTFDGAFELNQTLAGPLLQSVAALPEHAHRFDGAMSGHVTIAGALENPTVRARVKTDNFSIDQVDFGATRVNIKMTPEDPWLTIQSRHQPQEGNLEVAMKMFQEQPAQFGFKAKQVDMKLITPFLGQLEAQGSVSGQGEFTGELTELNGQAQLRVSDLDVYGFQMGQTDLEFSANDGQSKVTGSCVAGAAQVSASMTLGERLPYTATMQLNQVNIAQIHSLPENVELWLTGSLFSQGDFSKPEEIIADSVFDEARLIWNDIEFSQARPVRMNYSDEILEFSDAAFSIPELTIRLAGQVPLNSDLSLRLNLNGDLSMVPRFWNDVTAGQGNIDANLLMEGTFDKPIYAGHAIVQGGTLRLSSLQEEIEDIQARLDISGRSVQITEGTARIGTGNLQVAGGVILVQDGPTQTNLQATFSTLRLRPDQDLDLTASGTLQLIGSVGSLELRGDVELLSLHYTANIELDDMLRKKAKPLPLPGLSPGEAWNLRVNIRGENNLLFTNNFLESELSANLRLTGTTQHMGAIGTITPIWGRSTYAGNTYKVERGIIDFVEEYRISPRFEFRASTEACNGLKLTVNINGNDNGYSIQAQGQDDNGTEIDSQEALMCAQFGLRLDQDNAANTLTNPDSTSSVLSGAVDAIWKVTGMDERVRRILPVVDQFTLTSGYSKTSRKTEPRILVTKELGKDWELKYNGPLNEKDEQHIIALEYRLSSRITLQSTWISVSDAIPSLGDLGLDLRLDWQFE